MLPAFYPGTLLVYQAVLGVSRRARRHSIEIVATFDVRSTFELVDGFSRAIQKFRKSTTNNISTQIPSNPLPNPPLHTTTTARSSHNHTLAVPAAQFIIV